MKANYQPWVYIEQKKSEGLAPYASVKDYVAKEYAYRTGLESQDKAFNDLRSKYTIDIQAKMPDSITASYPQLSQR
jgi:peptidyl-prolyl cis-trans isomerase C